MTSISFRRGALPGLLFAALTILGAPACAEETPKVIPAAMVWRPPQSSARISMPTWVPRRLLRFSSCDTAACAGPSASM